MNTILLGAPCSGNPAEPAERLDLREQLFNEGAIGKIQQVQVSAHRVVQLNGIMFDVDPHLYRSSPILPAVPLEPEQFYNDVAYPWLSRHSVLQRAEVRMSGTGLHVIVRFDQPVIIESDEERKRWVGIVKVVQCVLPIDPDQPHITAVTRANGSINSKNNAIVRMLKVGEPIPRSDVLALYDEMIASPVKTVLRVLTGGKKVDPCPICAKEGSSLTALDFVGRCYVSCGKVLLDRLYDLVLAPRTVGKEAINSVPHCH